jgi:O-antigen ligase
VPPVFFTIFVVASFFGWQSFGRSARLIRYLLVVMAVIMATAYSGSRMIFLTQVLTFAGLAFIVPVGDIRQRAKVVAFVGGAGVLGLSTGLAMDLMTDCGFVEKLRQLFMAASTLDPDEGVSINARAILLERGWQAVQGAPWLGYGIAFEKQLSEPYYHLHNQYLTWTLWGGVFSLISGLMFILSASLRPLRLAGRGGLVLALAATGVLALNSLTDSLLYHTMFQLHYLMVLTLVFGLGRTAADAGDFSSQEQRSSLSS